MIHIYKISVRVEGVKYRGRIVMTSQENTFWINQHKIRMSKTSQIIKFKIDLNYKL